MKTILLFIFMVATFGQQKPITLEDLRWKNRVLLVFSQEFDLGKSEDLKQELAERKLLYFVFEDVVKSNSSNQFSDAYKEALIKKYRHNSKEAKWVLIGLDGGVKLQEQSELNWDKVFQTIDSMPMRQSEIRNGLNQQ